MIAEFAYDCCPGAIYRSMGRYKCVPFVYGLRDWLRYREHRQKGYVVIGLNVRIKEACKTLFLRTLELLQLDSEHTFFAVVQNFDTFSASIMNANTRWVASNIPFARWSRKLQVREQCRDKHNILDIAGPARCSQQLLPIQRTPVALSRKRPACSTGAVSTTNLQLIRELDNYLTQPLGHHLQFCLDTRSYKAVLNHLRSSWEGVYELDSFIPGALSDFHPNLSPILLVHVTDEFYQWSAHSRNDLLTHSRHFRVSHSYIIRPLDLQHTRIVLLGECRHDDTDQTRWLMEYREPDETIPIPDDLLVDAARHILEEGVTHNYVVQPEGVYGRYYCSYLGYFFQPTVANPRSVITDDAAE